jgi:hypothetical protein
LQSSASTIKSYHEIFKLKWWNQKSHPIISIHLKFVLLFLFSCLKKWWIINDKVLFSRNMPNLIFEAKMLTFRG